jgi:hypothetical protein
LGAFSNPILLLLSSSRAAFWGFWVALDMWWDYKIIFIFN